MTERRGFGLYVHWPFCQAKCPYCDFNSHVSAQIDQEAWVTAFQSEIARSQHDLPNRTLDTIFFGGGTPSLMQPETVDAIISAARKAWPFANDVEITLEANPTSIEADRFRAFRSVGVNRVSIGVQSLNNEDLRRLGRLHSADEAKRSIDLAKSLFPRVSFDLIYARQDQSLENWERELSEALELAEGHVSLYQLTIEPGTAFGDRFAKGKLRGLPNEDLAADMFDLTQEMTLSRGLLAYEVSNHASPGNESRHNLIYWRGHDWLGIGPGAHGRFTTEQGRIATEAESQPAKWLSAVGEGSGECLRKTLSQTDDVEERLMMGLRLSEGLREEEFCILFHKFNKLVEIEMLARTDGRIHTTSRGRPVLNAVVRELLT